MKELSDFPKLESPFIRKEYKVSEESYRKFGRKYQLRGPDVYLVTPEIDPRYSWVFDDPSTIAVEKLDGSNTKLLVEDGKLVSLMNRKNQIDPLNILCKGRGHFVEGIFQAIAKGWVEDNKEQAGEMMGPKLQGNPYKLIGHLWYPFDRTITALAYKSWHNQERSFDNISSWMDKAIKSRFYIKTHKATFDDAPYAEGVIFYNLARKAENKSWRCKLRRDMYSWYYEDIDIIF